MSTIVPQKRCTKCGNEFPATTEFFNKNCKAKDGLHPNCKGCRAKDRQENAEHIYQQKKNWRENNPDKEKQRVQTWISANRERYLESKKQYYRTHRVRYLEYGKRRYYSDKSNQMQLHREYYRKNRESILLVRKQRYASDPEMRAIHKAKWQEWRVNNPELYKLANKISKAHRRARLLAAGGTFTKDDILLAYRAQHGKCWHCGARVGLDYHADHLIPLAKGGSNDARNIVVSCAPCNLSKGSKFCWEWNGRLL